jgi:TonB family protein
MRTLLVASLIATSALLNAQTSPKGQVAMLEARVAAPAPLATDVAASSPNLRVTTGVTAAKLISALPIMVSTSDFPTEEIGKRNVEVHFTIDSWGVPRNVQLVKSVNPTVDARVVAAVSRYRYEPAKLDEWYVPTEMNLVVKFASK